MDKNLPPNLKDIKEKAEKIVKKNGIQKEDYSGQDFNQIIHDLQVHRIELELQNEELRSTQKSLENSREDYFNLFNKAPVGFMLLNYLGFVKKINSTLLELLDINSEDILGRPFNDLIHPEDRNIFISRLKAFFRTPENKRIDLRVKKGKSNFIYARIEGQRLKSSEGSSEDLLLAALSDISKEKIYLENLKTSEKLNHSIVEAMMDSLIIADLSGSIINVNRTICSLLGVDKNELINSHVTDLLKFPKDFRWEDFKSAVIDEINPLNDVSISKDKKNIRVAELNARLFHFEGKDVIFIFLHDVTELKNNEKNLLAKQKVMINLMEDLSKEIDERKKAGERLKISEEKFKDLLKNFPNGSVNVYDRNYRYIYADGKTLLSPGLSTEKFIGKTIYDIFPKEKCEYLTRHFQKVWNAMEISFEFELNGKFYMMNAVPLFQGLSKVHQIMVIAQDITELKTASIAISQNQAYLNSIFKAASIGIGVIADRKIQFVNDKICKMLGYKKSELIDRNFRACFENEDEFNRVDKLIHDNSVRETVKNLETKIKTKDGKIIDILMTSAPIDLEDLSKGITITCLDISDRKQVEMDILAYQEALRNLYSNLESVREKERKAISREIHDDLGQNLTALRIDFKMLKKVIDNKEKSEEILNQIDELLKSSIQSVREISANLRPDLLDNLGLEAAVRSHAEKFQNRTGIECEIDIEQNLELNEKISVAIFRIIQEATTNIIRHADASKIFIQIEKSDNFLVGSIKDNGKGIPNSELKDLNSLGLISMRERAANLNGKLNISSSGDGTLIEFKIPILQN